jgi:predicted nucleotidyltransferase
MVTISTMRFVTPLDSIFDQATKVKVLRRLFVTQQEMTIRQIAASVGMSHVQAGASLAGLQRDGVVTNRKVGRAILYKPNMENVISQTMLAPLFDAEKQLRNRFLEVLGKSLKSSILGVYIYGSFATVTEGPESDIDLLVIPSGRPSKTLDEELAKLTTVVRAEYGNELNALVLTLSEIKKRFKAGDKLIGGMVASSLPVIGKSLSEVVSDD